MSDDEKLADKPKRKRGRPRKVETEPAPVVEASPPPMAPVEPPKPAPAPAPVPSAFTVTKDAHYIMRGRILCIAEGTRVTHRTHDLDALIEQGVELTPEG